MEGVTVWQESDIRQEFHLQIHKQCGGWIYHCPEHHGSDMNAGPYRDWQTARDLANLHLRNYNHY